MKNILNFNKTDFSKFNIGFASWVLNSVMTVALLFSCNNVYESVKTNNETLNPGEKVILYGTIPAIQNNSGERSAISSLSGADIIGNPETYTYKITLNGIDMAGSPDVSFDRSSGTFSLPLGVGDNVIEVYIETDDTDNPGDQIKILTCKKTIPIGSNSPRTLSEEFALKKIQDGTKNGRIKLSMTVPYHSPANVGDIKCSVLTLLDTEEEKVAAWKTALGIDTVTKLLSVNSSGKIILGDGSGIAIKSGSYKVQFDFYDDTDDDKNILYSTEQVIKVYNGLLTDKWLDEVPVTGTSNSPVKSDGTFEITSTILDDFAITSIFIDPVNGLDCNGGSSYGKFKTLKKALDTVLLRNNLKNNVEFNVYLCGDIDSVTGKQDPVTLDCSARALKLNLKSDGTSIRRIYGKDNQNSALIKIKGKSKTDTVIKFDNIILNGNKNVSTDTSAESQGGAVYVNNAKLTFTKCTIASNNAKNGAGIYCDTGAEVIADTGTSILSNNYSNTEMTDKKGGGIYAAGTVTVKCTMETNKAECGGAIYVSANGNFTVDGDAWIKRDSIYTSVNDVFLSDGKTVTVGSNLSKEIVAYITPENPGKGVQVLSANSSKFGTSYEANSYKIAQNGKTLELANVITTIYVNPSNTNSCDPSGNTKDNSTWKHYNSSSSYLSSYPFKTLDMALKFITWQNENTAYTITISGTLSGAQTIANNSNTNSPITLKKNDSNGNITKLTITGQNSATLDGGFAKGTGGNPDTIGTTLTIDTAVPVEITSVTIKNGYQPSGTGGGIYIKNANADVTLKSGVTVYGQANKGGGIYNKGTLTIDGATIRDGHALVYSSSACGGGIYNEKNLYMKSGYIQYCKAGPGDSDTKGDGAGVYSTGSSAVFDMTGGYIYNGNAAKDKGGGVYIGGGSTFYMSGSAYIGSSNPSEVAKSGSRDNQAKFGGGLYVDQASKAYLGYLKNGTLADTFSGGIKYNYAVSSGGGIYIGTGSGNGKDGQVYMAKGVISHNAAGENATNSTAGGGGVQTSLAGGTKSLFKMTGGTVCNNRAAAGGGVYATGKFVMEGGSLENNDLHSLPTEKNGGAVYVGTSGVFEVKGDVSIPYGGSKDNNDVYIGAQLQYGKVNYGTTITITDSLSDNVSIYVTPQTYTDAGYKWFSESSEGYISAHYKKFHVTPNNGPYYVDNSGKIGRGVIVSSEDDFSTAVSQLTQDGDKIVFDNGGAVVTSFSSSVKAALNGSTKKIHLDLTQVSGNPKLEGYTTIQELSVNGASFFSASGRVMVTNCSSLKTINIYGSSTIENNNYPRGFGTINFVSDCSSFEAFNFVDATSVCLVGGLLNIWKDSSLGNTPRYIRTSVINIYIPESATNIEIHDRFEIQGTDLNAFEYVRFIYKGSLTKLQNDVTITRVRYADTIRWSDANNPDGVDIYYNGSTTQYKRWKPTANSPNGTLN